MRQSWIETGDDNELPAHRRIALPSHAQALANTEAATHARYAGLVEAAHEIQYAECLPNDLQRRIEDALTKLDTLTDAE